MREEREKRKRAAASRAQKKEPSTAAERTSDDSSETEEELSKEEEEKKETVKKLDALEAKKKKGGRDPATSRSETSNGRGFANKENEPISLVESVASTIVAPGNGSFVLGVTVDEAAVVDRPSNLGRPSTYSPVTYSPRQYSLVASPVSNSRSKILPTR